MSTSLATLPRPSPSNNRIAVLGGGGGLGSVLSALRGHDGDLTVIVPTVESAVGGRRRAGAGSAVADLRRSLEALTDDNAALARAIRRPLHVDRRGRHPLGNLVLQSLAAAFGDLGKASTWLGAQLGIAGSVLPVTVEPVRLVTDTEPRPVHGGAPGSPGLIERLRFVPERPLVSVTILNAIKRARWILLAPGPLWRSTLATSAVPDVAAALGSTLARIVWICNLKPENGETAQDQLAALRRHGVRVDAVMYDPSATLHFAPEGLAGQGIDALPRQLAGSDPGVHDRQLLRKALTEYLGSAATSRVGAWRRD